MLKNFLFTYYLLLILSGCGFKPLYGQTSEMSYDNLLSSIKLEAPTNVEEAEFYSNFSKLMPLTSPAKFLLKVRFSNFSIPQIIQQNSDVMREMSSLIINYELLSLPDLKILNSGKINLNSSYQCNISPYKTYLHENNIKKVLHNSAAFELRNRIILYFNLKDNLK